MRWRWVTLLLLVVLAGGRTCQAEDRLGISAKAGSLGAGIDLTGAVNEWFGLRATANGYSLSRGFDKEDIHYDGDFKLGAYGVLADFYPFKGRFRVTGGALKNRNKIELDAAPTSNVQIGDNTYTPAQVGRLTGDLTFKSSVAYLGIGYGNAAKGPARIGFAFDFGVMPQGHPNVSLASSTGLVSSTDLQKEETKVSDDTRHFKVWPVLAVGLSFRL